MIMGGVSVNKKYKMRYVDVYEMFTRLFPILFALFMTIITSGAWLMWVLIRYIRTH